MDPHVRELVISRAADRCEYCQLQRSLQPLPFHIEHIVARQHGGGDDPDNLAWSCDRCNAYKGPNLSSIDPLTGEVVALFHPRRDVWLDHFQITNGVVDGITPTRRATARLLQMNASRRVELRRELTEE